MPLDIVFLGVQMPTLLPIFVIVGVLQVLIDRIMSDAGFYNYVWHPGLFRTALFVILFALPCLSIYHY